MRFLHISDLHFGVDKGETARVQRDNYMRLLLDQIKEIANSKAIDYIFITGDIGWYADKSDYALALVYIRELMEICKIDAKRVFMCPGNHDVDRNAIADKAFPNDQNEANRWLKVERLSGYLSPCFAAYNNFCRELGVNEYRIGSQLGYLVGSIEKDDIRVISLNSAWYAQSDEVKDKMWVGTNFLQVIKRDLSTKNDNEKANKHRRQEYASKLTVALVHHPSEKWHEDETHNFPRKANTFNQLCCMSDIILTGHTHETKCNLHYREGTSITGTGALYNDSSYHNAFYLYEFTQKCTCRTQYFYYKDEWRISPPEEISGYKLKEIYNPESKDTIIDLCEKECAVFDKDISAISYRSVDECVLKWYRTDIREGCPFYRDIDSNESALNLMSQFICYEGRDDNIKGLFEKCLSRIENNELVVFRGTQGTGKSTIMSMLYIMALNRFRSTGKGLYPIYIDIHKYVASDDLGNMKGLMSDLNQLDEILQGTSDKKYIIFIDGIDEYVSDSDKYEKEIFEKLIRKHEERVVLCIGRIEDVDERRIAYSQFSNMVGDDSVIIETKALQIHQSNVEALSRRFVRAFNYELSQASKNGLVRWIKQYSGDVIDFRTLLMLLNIAVNDETSVGRSLTLNLKSHLMRTWDITENGMAVVAATAVTYMMGGRMRSSNVIGTRQKSVIHKNKMIRDYLFSYYFVHAISRCGVSSLSRRLLQICGWTVVFPRTVCRFIRDMVDNTTKRTKSTIVRNLSMMYEQSSKEMKINIGYLLGRIGIDKAGQKELLVGYIEKVDPITDFSLYRTLAISLIYLYHENAGEVYIDLLMTNPDYARKHLQLHFEYCYGNCDYISEKGRIESSKTEVISLVIYNTRKHIVEILNDRDQKRKGGILATDVITFCTALITSANMNIEKERRTEFLNEAQIVHEKLLKSTKVNDKLKQFVTSIIYVYEMHMLNYDSGER